VDLEKKKLSKRLAEEHPPGKDVVLPCDTGANYHWESAQRRIRLMLKRLETIQKPMGFSDLRSTDKIRSTFSKSQYPVEDQIHYPDADGSHGPTEIIEIFKYTNDCDDPYKINKWRRYIRPWYTKDANGESKRREDTISCYGVTREAQTLDYLHLLKILVELLKPVLGDQAKLHQVLRPTEDDLNEKTHIEFSIVGLDADVEEKMDADPRYHRVIGLLEQFDEFFRLMRYHANYAYKPVGKACPASYKDCEYTGYWVPTKYDTGESRSGWATKALEHEFFTTKLRLDGGQVEELCPVEETNKEGNIMEDASPLSAGSALSASDLLYLPAAYVGLRAIGNN